MDKIECFSICSLGWKAFCSKLYSLCYVFYEVNNVKWSVGKLGQISKEIEIDFSLIIINF